MAAGAASEPATDEGALSIYKAARRIKRRESTLYNALRSVADDAAFVAEIAALWPALPLVANLRCGLWYTQPRTLSATCYFKSTDGHAGNWGFSTARLNLHLALLAGERGGSIIVDSTRKGKRFPDSMSKTIPIWCCVLNRAIQRHRLWAINQGSRLNSSAAVPEGDAEKYSGSSNWDSSVHLPVWVLDTEKNAIEGRIEEWADQFESCGADIHSLSLGLQKPLRPLWISQRTRIWLNEVPEHRLWEFTPIILVSASASGTVPTQRVSSEYSWHYIPGAGDDEESWARGLTPALFWKHSYDLLDGGPDLCNQLVADIVEKDRVYRAQRGEYSPQITAKHLKSSGHNDPYCSGDHATITQSMNSGPSAIAPTNTQYSSDGHVVFWIGPSNLVVSSTRQVADGLPDVDCILNCDSTSRSPSGSSENSYLELPIVGSKDDRFSLLKNLPRAISFAKKNLTTGRKMLLCCQTGEDISICVALAIITRLIREIFNPLDVRRILQIPISQDLGEDFVAWHKTSNFCFSVRSAYYSEWEHQFGLKIRSNVGQGSSSRNPVWEIVWKLQVPSKVRIFIWRALHGLVPGMAILANRHIKVPAQCPICKMGAEDILHLIFTCNRAKEV